MMDASQITSRLWIGANINTAHDVSDLAALGITHVIDCNTDDETQLVLPYHINLLSNPTQDDGAIKPSEWFRPSIEFGVAALAAPGNRLFCHCAAGVNRGPSTGYAVLRSLGWWPVDARMIIHLHRPVTVAGLRYADDADAAVIALGWVKP